MANDVCWGHQMPLEAADTTIFVQQVKHPHLIDVDLLVIHFGFLFKNLVDFHWVPNDMHKAQKWRS